MADCSLHERLDRAFDSQKRFIANGAHLCRSDDDWRVVDDGRCRTGHGVGTGLVLPLTARHGASIDKLARILDVIAGGLVILLAMRELWS